MKYIFGHDNWCKAYAKDSNRRRVWIYFKTSEGTEVYLSEYEQWLTVQDYLDKYNITIKEIGLQYRSHRVSEQCSNKDGIYVVRSVKGELQGNTKHCYTIGIVKGSDVYKTMWLTPALVEESKVVDSIEDCFEEAIVYNDKESKVIQ